MVKTTSPPVVMVVTYTSYSIVIGGWGCIFLLLEN